MTERQVYRLGWTLARSGGFIVVYLPTPEDTLSYCVVDALGRVVRALRTLKAARRAARRLTPMLNWSIWSVQQGGAASARPAEHSHR